MRRRPYQQHWRLHPCLDLLRASLLGSPSYSLAWFTAVNHDTQLITPTSPSAHVLTHCLTERFSLFMPAEAQ